VSPWHAAAAAAAATAAGAQPATPVPSEAQPVVPSPRAHTCTRADTLRVVVEALSLPGVRRLVVVDAATHRVEGVVSLSDVVGFLLS
jgi:5'-AMP-activated protein kinase regulatory gamma subunit